MIARLAAALVAIAPLAQAQDVLILGEVHDNPAHHLAQAAEVEALSPSAIVFEMLTAAQADGAVMPQVADADALSAHLNWGDSGWPDFSMYHPIFTAAPGARIFGAGVSREAAFAAIGSGIAEAFAGDASAYGLDQPLPEDQQEAREELQFQAHCEALPRDILPGMVAVQRLRDAELARVTLTALEVTGGPVAVITGNGHARRDWGMPVYLERVAPGLEVVVIGQTEDNDPLRGTFDKVLTAPSIERPDPCEAFR